MARAEDIGAASAHDERTRADGFEPLVALALPRAPTTTRETAAPSNARRRWLGAGISLVASAAMALFIALVITGGIHDEGFGPTFLLSFTYAASCAVPANFLLPWIVPKLHRWGVLWQWLAIIVVVLVVTCVGCLFTIVVLTAGGLLPEGQVWARYQNDLQLALLGSFTLGAGPMLYESVRARLVDTTAALRLREHEAARARTLAAEARLSLLSARVHPHFLFNALNGIATLTREDPADAERMVEQLAALLRFSLDAEHRPVVPLARELKVIGDLLAIEGRRFGARLVVALDVAPGLDDAAVPPLSLQTLVENALKHAANKSAGATRVWIVAHSSGDRLLLSVEDDGPGPVGQVFVAGHGLFGLRERLRTLYGERATVALDRQEGRTVATMTLPLLVTEETA